MANTTDKYFIKIEVDVANDKELARVAGEIAKLQGKAVKANQGMAKSAKQTQVAMRSSGQGLTNFSYQMQDIIVQTSGGVDVMRSLSQQLPQMMIGMGAFGAAVGVVAAGLPLLIQGMKGASDEVLTLDESFESLESAVSDLDNFLEVKNLDNWNKAWLEADDNLRQVNERLLALRLTIAESRLSDLGTSMKDEAEELSQPGIWDVVKQGWQDATTGANVFADALDHVGQKWEFWESQITSGVDTQKRKLDEQAKALGVTSAEMQFLIAIQQKGAAVTDDQIALLVDWAKQLDYISPRLKALIDQYTKIQKLRNETSASRDNIPGSLSDEDAKTDDPAKVVEFGPGMKEYNDELKRRNELQAAYFPEAVKLNAEMQRHWEALERNIITRDQYNVAVAESKEAFELASQGAVVMVDEFNLAQAGLELFDQSFDTMLNGVLMGTRSLSDAFTDMAKVIIAQMLKLAAYKALSGTGGGIGAAFTGLLENADGNAFSNGKVTPFAKGGVVSGPTVFPMANGAGLMGEAGPEAIMPLKRGADGKLGVAGGGMAVTINNMAPGVDVNATQGENGLTIDVVMRQLSAAIGQGGNQVSESLERAYSLGRGRAVY